MAVRKITKPKPEKVMVALSGGLDSAVSAALLQQAGYEVAGCFMKLWVDEAQPEDGASTEAQDRARKIANYLDIPFFVFDLQAEFDQAVIQPFLKVYQAGLTPNPCVFCNEQIKFDLFWQRAQAEGADFMATGHYVILRPKNNLFELHRGDDKSKDQSYFLWRLNQAHLQHSLFPLGHYRKHRVRKLAERWKLPAPKRLESMEICFIPGSIDNFLSARLKLSPGPIIDDQGQELGQHQGLPLYTIGQRKKIGLTHGPYYVRKKDIKKNTLLVTKDKRTLANRHLFCNEVNWIDGVEPNRTISVKAKIRYHHRMSAAKVSRSSDGRYRVDFRRPQAAITPGQSVVFYRGSKLLGGGVIIEE